MEDVVETGMGEVKRNGSASIPRDQQWLRLSFRVFAL